MSAPNFVASLNQKSLALPDHFPAALQDLVSLIETDFPIPLGFIIKPDSFEYFIHATGLDFKIKSHLQGATPEQIDDLDERSRKIRSLFSTTPIPTGVSHDIANSYHQLSLGSPVLVRPYLPLPLSFTQKTQVTSGDANLLEVVKSIWFSLFTPSSLFYLLTHHLDPISLAPYCLILKYLDMESSGLIFSTSTEPNQKQHLVIKSVWGFSDPNSLPAIPDTYTVHKPTRTIVSKEIVPAAKMQVYQHSHHQLHSVTVPAKIHSQPKLTDEQIFTLTQIGKNLQQLQFYPQAVHWFLHRHQLFLTSTQNLHSFHWSLPQKQLSIHLDQTMISSGQGSFSGICSGVAQVVTSSSQLTQVKPWHLVVTSLPLSLVNQTKLKCLGVITTTSATTTEILEYTHNISKPLITNSPQATHKLKSNFVYTINGSTGEMFPGSLSNTAIRHLN